MSEQSSQEPTMEEILASIRRIISEDDAPADAAQAAPEPAKVEPPKPEPVVQAAPAPEPEDDDALELTQKVDTLGDLDVYTPPAIVAPAPAPEPAPAPAAAAPSAQPTMAGLVSERASAAAASAFGQLSAAIAMPSEARNLEDIVREMLRPMLQSWLDQNLPAIVQQAVEAEVERIARARAR